MLLLPFFSHLMSVEIHSREIDISYESQSLHLCLFVYEFFFVLDETDNVTLIEMEVDHCVCVIFG